MTLSLLALGGLSLLRQRR
ncbi:MAG: hypothetical protein JXD22_10915 [Sedimentisphaerales bacterium]|nr:hypothetical protein [Sedimentisphaerales bacterium]